ncbi:hypothetical protein M877_27350 [Streptomyces niveus NCIMB 11891]|nr:hypothetical protein M877_27350 [Streptomyces niveus NCIMB 11891]
MLRNIRSTEPAGGVRHAEPHGGTAGSFHTAAVHCIA